MAQTKLTNICYLIGILLISLISTAWAANPIFRVTAISSPHLQLARNQNAVTIFQVTNTSPYDLKGAGVVNLPSGITQVSTSGYCPALINLTKNASCLLKLAINANQLVSNVVGGPIICYTPNNPVYCSQPNNANQLNIQLVTQLNGVVSMGTPVVGAQVTAYAVNSAGQIINANLGQATSGSDGSFTLNLPLTSPGQLVLTATGGAYLNLFNNSATTTLPITLHSFVANNSATTMAITPVTEAFFQYAQYGLSSGATTANIQTAAVATKSFLYGIDPTTTLPVNFADATAMGQASAGVKVYSALLGILLRYETVNQVSLQTLTQWTTPASNGTCATAPYATGTLAIPTSFLNNICVGPGNGSSHTPNVGNTPATFGFLSDYGSLFYNSATAFISGGFNYTGSNTVAAFKILAEGAGNTLGTADSASTTRGNLLTAYLNSFNVAAKWLKIAAGGTLVNWQTGDSAGPPSCTGITKPAGDTFCSSFVSAVVYSGYPGLFNQGAILFLHPYNGPAATVTTGTLTPPLNQCAARDFLTGFQQEWLRGILTQTHGPAINTATWQSWDYTALPVPSNAGWIAVTTSSSNPVIQAAIQLGSLTGNAASDNMIIAQRLANQGQLVIASYAPTIPAIPGHITVVRPSSKSTAAIIAEGPDIISAGEQNFTATSMRQAFNAHSCNGGTNTNANYCPIGAWESMSLNGQTPQILFFCYPL